MAELPFRPHVYPLPPSLSHFPHDARSRRVHISFVGRRTHAVSAARAPSSAGWSALRASSASSSAAARCGSMRARQRAERPGSSGRWSWSHASSSRRLPWAANSKSSRSLLRLPHKPQRSCSQLVVMERVDRGSRGHWRAPGPGRKAWMAREPGISRSNEGSRRRGQLHWSGGTREHERGGCSGDPLLPESCA